MQRKWKNLGKEAAGQKAPVLNFGGQGAELWCEGGEEAFVCRMIEERAQHSARLSGVYRALKQTGVLDSRTIEMAQGQKKSRIVARTFLDESRQRVWRMKRWK